MRKISRFVLQVTLLGFEMLLLFVLRDRASVTKHERRCPHGTVRLAHRGRSAYLKPEGTWTCRLFQYR